MRRRRRISPSHSPDQCSRGIGEQNLWWLTLSWWRAKHQDRIQAAERERIRHRVGDFLVAADIGNVVEITAFARFIQANGGRHPAVHHGLDTCDGFDAAARTEGMSVHRLGR
jgi:hypothetical protein